MPAKTVFIAFGSNLGDRLSNITAALKQLAKLGEIKQISPLFETKPEGYLNQNNFINGAVEFKTTLPPLELLKELKKIEKNLGRKKTFQNAPRPIDLDIIFYEGIILNSPVLTLPHPAAHLREFVLLPLSFIAKDFMHPMLKKPVKTLLSEIMATKTVSTCKVYKDGDLLYNFLQQKITGGI
jgi:2-amino-4-hydroxy-6-hydroxymethyldihydropteridine diphosphokinase